MLKPLSVSVFSIVLALIEVSNSSGQSFPSKPIRIICPDPGGSGDFASRLIANGISGPLGQPVIVDNRGSAVSGQIVSQAPPDGYTLLVGGNSFVLGPLLGKTAYDTLKDFSAVTMAIKAPNVLAVHPSLPIKSVKELVTLAKAKSGQLNFASGSAGSSAHLAAELFKMMAGVNITHVPYRGTGPALNALLGGEVQLMFVSSASVAPHLKSGRLRALAVTGSEPSALAPGLPTVAASGVPGYDAGSWTGVFAPAKTPEVIINRLNKEIVHFLDTAEAKERLFKSGVEAVGSSSEELANKVKSELVRMGKVIKDAGIRDQ